MTSTLSSNSPLGVCGKLLIAVKAACGKKDVLDYQLLGIGICLSPRKLKLSLLTLFFMHTLNCPVFYMDQRMDVLKCGCWISAILFPCGLTGDALSVPRFLVCLVKPVPFLTQKECFK